MNKIIKLLLTAVTLTSSVVQAEIKCEVVDINTDKRYEIEKNVQSGADIRAKTIEIKSKKIIANLSIAPNDLSMQLKGQPSLDVQFAGAISHGSLTITEGQNSSSAIVTNLLISSGKSPTNQVIVAELNGNKFGLYCAEK